MAGVLNDIGDGLGLSVGLSIGGGKDQPTTATDSLPVETSSAAITSTISADIATSSLETTIAEVSSTELPNTTSETTSAAQSPTEITSTSLIPETSVTPSPSTTFLVGGQSTSQQSTFQQSTSQTTLVTSVLSSSSLTESIATSLGLPSSVSSSASSVSLSTPTPIDTSTTILSAPIAAGTSAAAVTDGKGNLITENQSSDNASGGGLSTAAIAGIAGGVGGAALIISTLFVLHRVWRKRRHGTGDAVDNLDQMYEAGKPEGFSSTDRLVRWNKGLSEYHRPDTSQAYKAYRM